MLHLRVLAQERRCLLQVERPDAEDKFRACERGEEDDGRDEEGDGGRGGVPQQKSRSAAACSITTDALPYRFRALPLDAVRLDVPHEHRALDNQGACMATASAPPGADTLVRGQPHRLREPRICQ